LSYCRIDSIQCNVDIIWLKKPIEEISNDIYFKQSLCEEGGTAAAAGTARASRGRRRRREARMFGVPAESENGGGGVAYGSAAEMSKRKRNQEKISAWQYCNVVVFGVMASILKPSMSMTGE